MSERTDRELLELAAKAAGLRWSYDLNLKVWNPLTDDGDALRLAVKLRMEFDHNHPADQAPWVSLRAEGQRSCVVEEFDDESQRLSATCRAIVRAAAEIGANMQS